MTEFSFEVLSPVEFEEFCYELLRGLDFDNLNWRKGTGKNASPADQGRDIEATWMVTDVDDTKRQERWFVECKHTSRGVGPEQIQGALAWAQAERPDVLLFIVSGALSNPAKVHLDAYKRNNAPTFRIKTWERKKLEELTAENTQLRRRFGLPTNPPHLAHLNSYHLLYVTRPHLNTVGTLITLMDRLDATVRDEALSYTYHDFLRPRYREPQPGNETFDELRIDEVSYQQFKAKCQQTTRAPAFVHALISEALAWIFHEADPSSLSRTRSANLDLINDTKQMLAEAENDEDRTEFARMLAILEESLADLPARKTRAHQNYTYMCDKLVRPLLMESETRKWLQDLTAAKPT